jgi:hypothetical protein
VDLYLARIAYWHNEAGSSIHSDDCRFGPVVNVIIAFPCRSAGIGADSLNNPIQALTPLDPIAAVRFVPLYGAWIAHGRATRKFRGGDDCALLPCRRVW